MSDLRKLVSHAEGENRSANAELPGSRHTRLLIALHDELLIQHPDAFFEDDDGHLVIPSGSTPQTAFVKIDTSSLAEAILNSSPATPIGGLSLGVEGDHSSSVAESASTALPKSEKLEGH